MPTIRPFAHMCTQDQWLRSAHANTFVDPIVNAVELAWTRPPACATSNTPPPAAGLAFDAECRLYRSLPNEGLVERSLWSALDPLAPVTEPTTPLDLFETPPGALGDFSPAEPPAGVLREPRGLAVDDRDRLFIAETAAARVLVYDLWSRRLLQRVAFDTGAAPLDLAACGDAVFAVVRPAVDAGSADTQPLLFRLPARKRPQPIALPSEIAAPSRIAISACGCVAVLEQAGTPAARVFILRRTDDPAVMTLAGGPLPVAAAGDLEFEGDDVLVIARGAGDDLLRFHIGPNAWTERSPLTARAYDGLGIVRTPDARIGFWTANGFRHAVASRVRYAAEGRVTTFRLDSGEFQTVWGRLFLDACVPAGTEIVAHCATADEPPEEATLPRTPPANLAAAVISRPDLSPPMPPLSLVPPDTGPWQHVHRRESGRELPWAQPLPDDPFRTYEAPVLAPSGRYLWITLRLRGTSRQSPRVRSLRVEHPSHDHLKRLPRTLSRATAAESFLRRYTAMADGLLMDLDSRAAARRALLDPRSAPAEVLPWLASFLGLPVDERWPETVLRQVIAEAVWLFRFRGTVPGLRRFLEIYLGVPVVIIEHFRLRGLGGAIVGEAGPATSRAVIGVGFRVGGALGAPEEAPLSGSVEDAFETHAHRFTVVIPGLPATEQLAVVRHILEVHRPAHTIFQVCTAGAGMRVGRGLHVGLSSILGRTGGFAPIQLDAAVLGRGAIVGRPEPGTQAGSSRIGADSRVG